MNKILDFVLTEVLLTQMCNTQNQAEKSVDY